jgi:hypothetical protein
LKLSEQKKHKTEPSRDQASPETAGIQIEKPQLQPTGVLLLTSFFEGLLGSRDGSPVPPLAAHQTLMLRTSDTADVCQRTQGSSEGGKGSPRLCVPELLQRNPDQDFVSCGLLRVALVCYLCSDLKELYFANTTTIPYLPLIGGILREKSKYAKRKDGVC